MKGALLLGVSIKLLDHYKGDRPPYYATSGASGVDLYASIPRTLGVLSGDSELVPTGISIAIPDGYEGQIRPRSGLALKKGVTVLNSPGTIDSDFRGEIKVLLINHNISSFRVEPGERIAQLVFSPIIRVAWDIVDELPTSNRGDGGFGSTGV